MGPVEAEATGVESVEVEYAGHTYEMPGSLDDCDADVLEAIDAQKLSVAIRALLGPAQYAAFKAGKPKVRDFGGLFDAYAERIGLGSTGN